MKERGFGRDPEPAVAQSHGFTRGATVTKLHRPAKAEEPDVDGLVTDFLHTLDAYAAASEAAELVVSEVRGPEITAPDPSIDSLPVQSTPIPGSEDTSSEARRLLGDLEAELDQTLSEIESHPKLTGIAAPIHEIARTPTSPPAAFETAHLEEAPATMPGQAEEVSIAEAAVPARIEPIEEARVAAEPAGRFAADYLPFSSAFRSHESLARRRLAIGLTVLAATAAVSLAIYIAFLMRSALTGIGAGASPPRPAQTTGPAGSQPGTADRQAAPTEGSPSGVDTPATIGTQPESPQAARAKAPAADVQAPGPGTRDFGNRTKGAPPARAPVRPSLPEPSAQDPAKKTPLGRNEAQGSNTGAVTPLQSNPPPETSAGVKSAEPQTMTQIQMPVSQVASAKSDAGPPPAEAPKAPPAVPPTPDGSSAVANRAAAADPKPAAPSSRTESVPLATPAEAISKVPPTYPITAQKMGVTGVVQVQVSIDERGRVTKATAISGQYVLRPAAEEALMKWKFKPATLRGESTKSELVVSVSFVK